MTLSTQISISLLQFVVADIYVPWFGRKLGAAHGIYIEFGFQIK